MIVLKNKKLILICGISIILIITSLIYYKIDSSKKDKTKKEVLTLAKVDTEEIIVESTFYVDVKGEVKNPGVYLVTEGDIVNDLIKKAGGLNKNAITKNINLSKKLSSEMIIYVYNKNEISSADSSKTSECVCNEVDCTSCIEKKCSVIVSDYIKEEPTENNTSTTETENTNSNTSTKVSINKATLEELMTLTGIGETKAKAIIEYREKNNGFTSVEDLLNVSGIGESTFAKIKENITL